MIHEELTWNASDLIYLFVDGEANDVQKSTLFAALANDTDLQTEFADALRINAATKNERGAVIPPPHVTTGLLQKAGLGAGAVASAGTASGVATVSTASTAGLSMILRKVGTPILTAFLGAAIALLLVPSTTNLVQQENGRISENRTLSEQIAAPSSSAVQGSITLPGEVTTKNSTATAAQPRNRIERSQRHAGTSSARFASAVIDTVQTQGEEAWNNVAQDQSIEFAAETIRTQSATDAESIAAKRMEARLMMTPESTPQTALSVSELQNNKDGHDPEALVGRTGLAEPEPMTFNPSTRRFSVQLRGIADLELFPIRSLNDGSAPAFGNVAVGVFYNLSRNHSIGVEAGREYHPLYVSAPPPVLEEDPDISGTISGGSNGSGSGNPGIIFTDANNTLTPVSLPGNARYTTDETEIQSYRLEPRSNWVGLSYRYRAGELSSRLPLRPYFQALVGASSFGPIGKGIIGLSWQPEGRVTFSLGLEGTNIMYKRESAWYSTRKLGATYSAQVEF